MNLFSLIIKEILFRRNSSLIILLTVLIAGTVSVAIYTLSKASEDETRKIMREQGLNLFIFPKGTNLIDLYTVSNMQSFPEAYVDTLAESKTFDAVRHLTGILQVKYSEWIDPNGSTHQIVLTGYKNESMQRFLPRQETMGFDVPEGKVHVGALVAKNIPEGEYFTITGKDMKQYRFIIEKRLEEGKGIIDQGVALNLNDLQKILDLEGQINKIEALGCVCKDGRIRNARKQVQEIFPNLEVTELSNIADARENQRLMMNRYGAFIISFVIITCMLISGLLFYQNILSRKYEIGLLKAMGNSTYKIIVMIVVKGLILGLLGAVPGFFAGHIIAGYFGSEIFKFTSSNIKPLWQLLIYCLIVSPVMLILSSWIPALIASKMDAARILGQDY